MREANPALATFACRIDAVARDIPEAGRNIVHFRSAAAAEEAIDTPLPPADARMVHEYLFQEDNVSDLYWTIRDSQGIYASESDDSD
jgi:hypothetical protein